MQLLKTKYWCRFGVGSLLVFMALVGMLLGVLVVRVERQKSAIRTVKRLGGTCRYDYQVRESLPSGLVALRRMLGVDYFSDIHCADLSGAALTTADLAQIVRLPKLQHLDLRNAHVAETDVDLIETAKGLLVLALDGTSLTPAAVSRLRSALPGTAISYERPAHCYSPRCEREDAP